jgi:hypothetical protein
MKLHVSRKHLSRDRISTLEPSLVRQCWNGEPLEPPFEWVLACDPERLWFWGRISGAASFDQSNSRGSFVEGLWERDVAEFFMMDAGGRYQEFNVSPSGAWWSCGFSAYRERMTESPVPSDVFADAVVRPACWEVVFSVPVRELLIPLDAVAGVHVSSIVRCPTTKYLSSRPIVGATPDFHDWRCFAPVERINHVAPT